MIRPVAGFQDSNELLVRCHSLSDLLCFVVGPIRILTRLHDHFEPTFERPGKPAVRFKEGLEILSCSSAGSCRGMAQATGMNLRFILDAEKGSECSSSLRQHFGIDIRARGSRQSKSVCRAVADTSHRLLKRNRLLRHFIASV